MNWWRRLRKGNQLETELNAELQYHLDRYVDDHVHAGMAPQEARRRARLEVGGLDQVKEECRDARGSRWVEDVTRDIRFTARRLVKDPSFTLMAVTMLALGIGATTAALNVAASVLLTKLPVKDETRLVLVSKRLQAGSTLIPYSTAEVAAWADASRTLESVAGVQYDGAWPYPVEFGERTSTVMGTIVSGSFFDVLGVRPTLGRLIRPDDANAGSEAVVVISSGLWRRQFGDRPSVVGQRVRLYGERRTIIGVAPPGFALPGNVEVWIPLRATPDVVNTGAFTLIGRLTPNATFPEAAQESSVLVERLRSIGPASTVRNVHAVAIPLKEAIVGDARPVMMLFVAAAVMLFLVGCINVTNLQLARGTARGREMVVRTALGATRSRLVGQLMTESASLAVAGGVLGAIVALGLQRAFIAAAPAGLPRLDQVGFNTRTLGLTAAGSMVAATVAGVVPAFVAVRHALFEGLRGNWTDGPRAMGTHIGRQILIASQLAFALIVTIAAVLLVRSLLYLQAVELGFSTDRLTVVSVPLVGPEYEDIERRRQFFDALVARMEALPGIDAVTPVLLEPFTGINGWDATFMADGQGPEEVSANPGLHMETVLPNYFTTMGIPIRRGRSFTDADRDGSQPVVIVSESLARHAWPGSTALGERLKTGPPDSAEPWRIVVGIVGDLRYRDLAAPPPVIYLPLRQTAFPPRALIVRTNVQDAPVLPLASRIVREIDSDEPVTEAASMSTLLAGTLAGPRFHMFALSTFALVVVLLAGVGVFGVLTAFVAQRSRELGVRVALGAKPSHLRWIVLSKVGWPAALGWVAGTCTALAANRFLRPLLFQVSAIDPEAFAAGWLVLALAAFFASLVPLRRAGRVDPVQLLRSE